MASRLSSRFVVLALALGDILVTGMHRRPADKPRRILIAHHLLLGDTLMLTPLLAKLRQRYPDAEIVMTLPKPIVPLYAGRPYGVEALAYDPRDRHTLSALWERRGFDLALVPGDNRFSWLARALGARWVVAFAGDRPAWKNWPADQLTPYPGTPAAWGDMVAGLVAGPAPRPYQAADWPAPAFMPFELPPQPYCVLHVGASSSLKMWAADKWLALAEQLVLRGFQPVWSGGPGEDALVSRIDPAGKYPSLAGRLDLPQLWHFLKHASLLVCPDTGVAHLGRLTGTPLITLFGPGSAVICGAGEFWRASPSRAVTAEIACRDQDVLFRRHIDWVRRCGRSTRECAVARCMEAIGVDTVLATVDEMLAGRV